MTRLSAGGLGIWTLRQPFGGKLKTMPQNPSVAPAKLAVTVHCQLTIRKRKNLISGRGAVYREFKGGRLYFVIYVFMFFIKFVL